MSFFGSIQHGIEDVGHAVVDAGAAVAHGAKAVAKDVVHGAEKVGTDVADVTKKVATGAAHALVTEALDTWKLDKDIFKQTALFGEGVFTGAILNALNAGEQLINHISGFHLPPLELPNQAEVDNSIAGKIGVVGGTALDFVATDGAVSAATELEASSALALGASGAIQGGLLTPSSGHGNFVTSRLEGAAVSGATGAVLGVVGGKAASLFRGAGAPEALASLELPESAPALAELPKAGGIPTPGEIPALSDARPPVSGIRELNPATESPQATDSLANRGAMTLSDGSPIDPITATTLKRFGLTPESYLYRVTDPKYLDFEHGTVGSNPDSVAVIRDPYNKVDIFEGESDKPYMVPNKILARDAGPGLNVAVGDPSAYAEPGDALIGLKVDDLLRAGGRIYPDHGAAVALIDPLYATFNEPVPFTIIPR